MNNPIRIVAIADELNHLTRAQCIEILKEPKKNNVIKELAQKYKVSEDFIKHVRYKCRFLLAKE